MASVIAGNTPIYVSLAAARTSRDLPERLGFEAFPVSTPTPGNKNQGVKMTACRAEGVIWNDCCAATRLHSGGWLYALRLGSTATTDPGIGNVLRGSIFR
jgi:hypothetical protein